MTETGTDAADAAWRSFEVRTRGAGAGVTRHTFDGSGDVATERLPSSPPRTPAYLRIKAQLYDSLTERLSVRALDQHAPDRAREVVQEMVEAAVARQAPQIRSPEREQLIADVINEFLGFGPLDPLLADPSVGDIMVNTCDEVYVERDGLIELTDVRFTDEAHLLRVIQRIAEKVGRRVDRAHPLVDARLPDGSRVNAVVPPIAVDGAQLSIRKFARIPFDLDRLVANHTMTRGCADILGDVVRARLNILIAGGTGTGKTTVLNALSRSIGARERVVTIEDAAELQLQQRHVVRLETRPADLEGKGRITQRDLVINALRMRPDRIILGEVRGGEAFDMLQAMNTGHDGSMTTVHANTPRDALGRLEQMVGMAEIDLPMRAIRSQIASALDLIVHLRRMSDGSRRLVSLQEIVGMESDVITLQELLRFEQTGVAADGTVIGKFIATGLRPHFYEKFVINGLATPKDLSGLAR
jgi:pilus assembly protein CpaF